MRNRLAPGIPGTLKLMKADVMTSPSRAGTLTCTPYKRPRKRTPATQAIGTLTRNTDTASGSANPVIAGDRPSCSCALAISAGSAASDERELKATACAGTAAAANSLTGVPPNNRVTG